MICSSKSEMENRTIERLDYWCTILTLDFERTLDNATAKVNLCFIRLMIKRLVS